jgi:uncharacterized protein YecE (DUF72 family)
MPGKILVGTASWTDPGFIAHWYPRTLAAAERLNYYAERFNLVEVNSSFYAVPDRKQVRRWCEQTPEQFTFDLKLHRLLSRHSTTLQSLPPGLRELARLERGRVLPTPELERALVRHTLSQVQPLCEAGKFGAFLLQLTPAFSPRRSHLEDLDVIVEELAEYALAVELRNRHWATGDQLGVTTEFFRQRNVTLVGVDAPECEHFMAMPGLDAVTNPKLTYLRLHGRNAKGYVTGRTVAERFDYLYSDQELEQMAQRATALARQSSATHVVYNNNARDYPLRNAATFQQLLARNDPSIAPPPLSRRKGKTLEFEFSAPDRQDR